MSPIRFEAKLLKINSWTILKLPKTASLKLPSRGMTMVEGTINGSFFKIPLEPDGQGGHWFKFENSMQKATGKNVGDKVSLSLEPAKDWPDPSVPEDLKKALTSAAKAKDLWTKITPNAHWDWIRWIQITKNLDTRKRRIEIALSKLKSGTRRPCCFNRNMCSITHVSKNGVLLQS